MFLHFQQINQKRAKMFRSMFNYFSYACANTKYFYLFFHEFLNLISKFQNSIHFLLRFLLVEIFYQKIANFFDKKEHSFSIQFLIFEFWFHIFHQKNMESCGKSRFKIEFFYIQVKSHFLKYVKYLPMMKLKSFIIVFWHINRMFL